MEDRWKRCATRSRCTTVSEDRANLLLTMSMELHLENMATVWSACRGQAAREIEQGVRAVTQCPIRGSNAVMLPTAVTAQRNGPMVLGIEDPLHTGNDQCGEPLHPKPDPNGLERGIRMRRIRLLAATVHHRLQLLKATTPQADSRAGHRSWGRRRSRRGGWIASTDGMAAKRGQPFCLLYGSSVTGGTGARSVDIIFPGPRWYGTDQDGEPMVVLWLPLRYVPKLTSCALDQQKLQIPGLLLQARQQAPSSVGRGSIRGPRLRPEV